MADIRALAAKAARQAGVPPALYESLILNGERSYHGWEHSPAGAFGPAQLMPGTAASLAHKYGVNVNTVYGNLLAGAHYLSEQLQAFGGNPRKAVAAYNAGPGNVDKYGGVPPFKQTQDYVQRVLGGAAGRGNVAAPVAPAPRSTPLSFVTAPKATLTSAPAPDIASMLADSIGKIGQGYTASETLDAVTPQILGAWMAPSKLSVAPGRIVTPRTSSPAPQPVPGAPVQPPAPLRGGAVSPIQGKLIGTPYSGTHAKQFNVQGGSDNWESENAVDVAAPKGTPIRAVTNGVIGPQFGSLGSGGRFAGLRLHLVGGGNEFYYAHLSRFAKGVKPGTRVRKGQVIGYSGEANGVEHLHFAAQKGDPRRYYGQ